MLQPDLSAAKAQVWCKPQAAIALRRTPPKKKKKFPTMLQNDLQWGHVKDVRNILGRGCWQGCERSLQPCKVNAPWMRNREQKCVFSVGKRNKCQSGHQWTPQFANSSRRPGGTTTDPWHSAGWPGGARRGWWSPVCRAEGVAAATAQPLAAQPAENEPFPAQASRQILLPGGKP